MGKGLKRKHKRIADPQCDWSAEKIRWWLRVSWRTLAYSQICVCGHLAISHDIYVRHSRPTNIQGRKCLKKICVCPKLCKTNLEYMEALYEAKLDRLTK